MHSFLESGNAYKVALMLELCGADWEPVYVDFLKGAARSERYREDLNSMGEVPVLVVGDRKLTQSGAILTYLAETFGKFGGKTEEERYEVLRWILFDNHKLTGNISILRFIRYIKKMDESQVTEFLEGRCHAALSILEKQLSTNRFVVGDDPTIADFSLCGYLFWPEQIGIDMDLYPNIKRWLDDVKTIENWKSPEELIPHSVLSGVS
nr:glutathione S-transferase family protein [Pseudovibrio flavus]